MNSYKENSLLIIFSAISLQVLGCDEGDVSVQHQLKKTDAQILNASIHPTLTVEESIGFACMHPDTIERGWHLCKRVHPRAVPQIASILRNEALRPHWPSAAESLAFVGGDSEAKLLIEIMRRQNVPRDASVARLDRDIFRSIMLALGLMARRGIPDAKRFAAELCHEDFWKSISDNGDRSFMLDMRREAIIAKAFADWDTDSELYQQLREQKDAVAEYIDEAEIEEILARMSKSEDDEVTESDRQVLMYCYNNCEVKQDP
jgi:hypothetical protein